jgi:alpha-methylacyl-CoA racemase
MQRLNKITVLDFSKLLPGPWCTMLLADLGCRVIKVELPHWPDMLRKTAPLKDGQGFVYRLVNRNKQSLCLDFRKPKGMKALLKMIAKADVVVEGFRPGMMEKFGLGPKTLLKKFPKLVYTSITGFGAAGENSQRAGHDTNFLAESGLLGAGDSNGAFSFPAAQLADLAGAHYAAVGTLGALLERRLGGAGRHVQVAMSEAAFSWAVLPIGHQLATGEPYDRTEAHWWSGRSPFYRLYRTSDGRYLCVAAIERPFAEALLRELKLSEWIAKLPFDTEEEERELLGTMERIINGKRLAHWEKRFKGKDVCVTPVRSLPEALERYGRSPAPGIPPMVARAQVRSPIRLSSGDWKYQKRPPLLGADNSAILKSFGFSAQASAQLKKAGLIQSFPKARKTANQRPPARN